jgi:hypothetical protein
MTSPQVRLEEQNRRRLASVPTVSVLVGPVGLSAACWRRWCAEIGRALACQSLADVTGLATLWTAELAGRRDLAADAAAWMARRIGRPDAEFRASLATKTVHDVEMLFAAVAFDGDAEAEGAICRRLLTWKAAGVSVAPERLAGELDRVLTTREEPGWRVIAALTALAPAEALPGVLLAPQETPADPVGWIDSAARLLTGLAIYVPRVPAAMTVERQDLERYLTTARESQAMALVREGLVTIGACTEKEVRDRLGPTSDEVRLSGAIRRLAADGADAELVEAFRRAAAAAAEPSADDGARSEAERFLYARLESLAATIGLFVMNAELDFMFGRGKAEVDFLGDGLKMVIEVDGWFHFQNAEAYRRDRRKDWELQRRGYLVLRFLAEDVVSKLEEVLDTILAAVAWRREAGCEKEQLC